MESLTAVVPSEHQPPEAESHDPSSAQLSQVIAKLDSSAEVGLTAEVAGERLKTHGTNEIRTRESVQPAKILLRQFQSTVVFLLLGAAGISFAGSAWIQGVAILVAVLVNALVGFLTEFRSQTSLAALEALTGPTARVIRSGKELEIPATHLVPGDLVLLDAGLRIPADLRLAEVAGLTVDESALTGESVPVYKSAKLVEGSEQSSTLAFQGTYVVAGRAKGIVISTGLQTKLGRLGKLISEATSTRTPLEDQLEVLGQQLTVLTLVLCALLAGIGILHNEELWMMLETSIALAVAAIPEGMPVVATLALAAGTRRMVKVRTLVRQLAAVETLGCTTVICTDKTGTLTENQMMVTDLVLDGRHLKVSGHGYEPRGQITDTEGVNCSLDDRILVDLLEACVLCNDARLHNETNGRLWTITGDPTEAALLVAAEKAGLKAEVLWAEYPRTGELPFDLSRKRMSTVHTRPDGGMLLCVKGSPESILALTSQILSPRGNRELSAEDREWLLKQNLELAGRGLRVIAVASRHLVSADLEDLSTSVEEGLTFLGLVAMADVIKPEASEAIEKCHQAGIRIVMLTGDQPATAQAIARELKIIPDGSCEALALGGTEIEGLKARELHAAITGAHVLARVTPEMKLSVVKALQDRGEIVAMTGDGVNDAPALRQANIGIAMGRSGTSLAREASNMVIMDDNFATIVRAIEEGRIIYANIRRSIAYLLTASLSAVLAVSASVLFGAGLPLTPLQLLWLNLIMHIFPGLAIVLQKSETNVMSLPPRNPGAQLLDAKTMIEIVVRSAVVGTVVVGCVELLERSAAAGDITIGMAKTAGFATLSLALLFQAWAWSGALSAGSRPFAPGRLSRSTIINFATSYLLLFVAIYMPGLQQILETHSLPVEILGIVLGFAMLSLILTEALWVVTKHLIRGPLIRKDEPASGNDPAAS